MIDWNDEHLFRYKAQQVRVLDADTIHCWVDLGMKQLVYKEVRIIGMGGTNFDAPEIKMYKGVTAEEKAHGIEAKAIAEELFLSPCRLVSHKDSTGKYGRMLATPWLEDDNGEIYDYVEYMRSRGHDTVGKI